MPRLTLTFFDSIDLVSAPGYQPSGTNGPITDPRLRRNPEAAATSTRPAKKIEMQESSFDVRSASGLSTGVGRSVVDVGQKLLPAKPFRFVLAVTPHRLKMSSDVKPAFDDFDQTSTRNPPDPGLPRQRPRPPLDFLIEQKSRNSSPERSSRHRSSRDRRSSRSSSDNEHHFGGGSAEAAKFCQSNSSMGSSRWMSVSRVKEEPPVSGRAARGDVGSPVRKRFKLGRDRDEDGGRHGSSRSRYGRNSPRHNSDGKMTRTEESFIKLKRESESRKK